ncbi:MAG TPA: hypothetical protein VMB72_08580 [Acidimicrobiales bacterium]|nr:hypothetical protein [Acidimicrobiales bacterium]
MSRWGTLGMVTALVGMGVMAMDAPSATAKSHRAAPEVLYVGTFDGITTPASQTFSTIQGAVNAATPGDWILIAPGDYHESDDSGISTGNAITAEGWYGGVVIDTKDIHLRGMNRNSVIVDGTLDNGDNVGVPCSSNGDDQNFLDGLGRNGILVWKADDVSIDNLTVCNFQAGTANDTNGGNEIWWNGGDGSGKVGLKGYEGSYLTATNTYFTETDPSTNLSFCDVCALYGIFSSNSDGGQWNQLYANNFADSGAYIGACHRVCNATVDNAWFEDNALGYSGTNSGGTVLIENSRFDDNKEGLDTNTALTGDPPPPQDGECPGNKATSASVHIPGSVNSCWVFTRNQVLDNNNPNVPVEGTAGLGLTGGGMTISGGRDDTVTDNEFSGNDGWGIVFAPYPDPYLTSDGKTCKSTGGIDATSLGIGGVSCLFDPEGDALLGNKFSDNGGYGNPSNADFGNLTAAGHEFTNCFAGNTEWNSSFTTETGPATDANVEDGYADQTPSTCGTKTAKTTPFFGSATDDTLLQQAECASGVLTTSQCAGAEYPVATAVTMEPLPGASGLQSPATTDLPTMPNPCSGAPTNLWCPHGAPA